MRESEGRRVWFDSTSKTIPPNAICCPAHFDEKFGGVLFFISQKSFREFVVAEFIHRTICDQRNPIQAVSSSAGRRGLPESLSQR